MKKLLLVMFVLASLSSAAFAGVDLEKQNWEMDMVSVGDSDC